MTTRSITSPTQKVLAYRLALLKEKMLALRQEEEKIYQTLAQELSQCLINAQALEIDFDVLLGGMLEVITQVQANSNKPTPEQTQKMEVWQKAGMKFRQNQNRTQHSNKGQKAGQLSQQQKKRDHQQAASASSPKAEKVA